MMMIILKERGGRLRRSFKRSPSLSSSRERSGRKVRTRRATKPPPQIDLDEEDKATKGRWRTQFANFSK